MPLRSETSSEQSCLGLYSTKGGQEFLLFLFSQSLSPPEAGCSEQTGSLTHCGFGCNC